ncbi:membrane-bound inhibitor of C-type lysozyme [Herbaspirillum sp. Sphag1AN]|uniref:MliC family protein n=1 Tax=unclassified Herbaspirillum TaxID=2624150 RepID=UPI00161C9516|nr:MULTISPECIES: MliC family protein [unclassified Herbaspirillum]MBB3213998.1 membrane-bound inhibitor of C-type lysozyme [Herbaspirillum sp. Sphag1AN]MBB3247609.1 membrane-bound inhibitor of C-type lysozyme [Herbaspirillum sp. Sphag64]
MRASLSLAAAALGAGIFLSNAVTAKTVPIAFHIPGVIILNQQRVIYRCAGDVRLPVRYLNTNAGALAYLSVGGKKRIFVNVVSASGARYVADRYAWWSKGGEGFLEDISREEGADPVLKDCRQVERW